MNRRVVLHVKRITSICFFFVMTAGYSQDIPVELMLGHKNLYTQHSFGRSFGKSRFGAQVTSSLLFPYEQKENSRSELMSQAYASWRPLRWLVLGLGTFYATKPGLKPSFNIQFSGATKKLRGMLVLRTDVKENPSGDFMAFAEYGADPESRVHVYARVQAMMSFSASGHQRSYQYLRLGFQCRMLQSGIALNLDAYGPRYNYIPNAGVFFRTTL